ncbi:MAG: ATP-binding protein [Isosphaeraceae bacterium]
MLLAASLLRRRERTCRQRSSGTPQATYSARGRGATSRPEGRRESRSRDQRIAEWLNRLCEDGSHPGRAQHLGKAEAEGGLSGELTESCKPRLPIIDESGYLPFERRAARLFFQLVNRRYEEGSLLVTTNQWVSERGLVSGDEVLATAILDR